MLVHGLAFDRRSWQPIIDRLGDSVTSLAIDLPAHGESKGEPVPMQDVADQFHSLVQAPGLERPIGVGQSIAAAAAGLSAATDPTRGIVIIDQATAGRRAVIEHCNRPGRAPASLSPAWYPA